MLELYEHVYKPKPDKRTLVFADFIAHIAFLASLPCPSFNTRYHIEFLNKTLTIDEPKYDTVPHKNERAINVLFEALDLRTILYCWKAILLNKTLVLISTSTSLQFYV